ncbi:MAG: glycosyltransferase [Thermodesulfovibrio sp.]|nr:glycosyltransferase [Thermodesulfovibrio sp.]
MARNINIPQIKVLESRIDLPGMPVIMSAMEEWINGFRKYRKCRMMVISGFHGIWEAHKDPAFRAVLNAADLWVPDGIAPVFIARLKGMPAVERTPGAEIMEAFFKLANKKGYSSFFYGDSEETLLALKGNLGKKYPGHKIAGLYSPPFRQLTPEEDEEILKMINESHADVLWVGLGLPKQERWIDEHKERLQIPIAAGVGAAFLFLSGKVKRVPARIGKYGLEWLWRLSQEPRKLWRRALIDGPLFIGHVLLDLAGLKKYD